jgi:hypothetical protein
MFNILLVGIIFAVAATLFRDGLWSNAITLINLVTAGIIAVNYFEPLTRYLMNTMPFMDYNLDVIVLGALFSGVYSALRYVGLQISKHRVRFHPLLDQIGSGLLALASGWTVVCFVTFALHTSPLAREFFFGGFKAENHMFFGLAPDRQWLGFVSKQSNGGSWGANVVGDQGEIKSEFDPTGEFLIKYASRRTYLEKHLDSFANPQ